MVKKTQGKRREGTMRWRGARRTEETAAQRPEREKSRGQRAEKQAPPRLLSAQREKINRELLQERGELPGAYGETRVVLFALDPHLMCAHWQVNLTDLRRIRRRAGSSSSQEVSVLRFYDVTHAAIGDTNVAGFFDIMVDLSAGNWYIHLWSPGRSYFAELGLETGGGRFIPIARSNLVQTPPAEPSEERREEYLLVPGEPAVTEKVEISPWRGVQTAGVTASPDFPTLTPDTREMALPQGKSQPEMLTAQTARIAPGRVLARDVIITQTGLALKLPAPSDRHLAHGQRTEPDLAEEGEAGFAPGVSSGTAPK